MKRISNNVGLRSEEYDFHKVPRNELESCCFYEYARESVTVVREVQRIRKEIRSSTEAKRLPMWTAGQTWTESALPDDKTHLRYLHSRLAGCKEFPELPWQLLSQSSRAKLAAFPKEALELELSNSLDDDPALTLHAVDDWGPFFHHFLRDLPLFLSDSSKLSIGGVFLINRKYGHEQIVATFREWLTSNYPETNRRVEKRGRKESPRDALNELAAMRLRYHCNSLPEAQGLIAHLRNVKNENGGMSYTDHRAWDRACKLALAKFKSMLGLSDSDIPVHYTKGWKTKTCPK